jgi:hypothetical protein
MNPSRYLFVGMAAMFAYAGNSLPLGPSAPPLRSSRMHVSSVPLPLSAQAYLASSIVHGVVASVDTELAGDDLVATRVRVDVIESVKGDAGGTTTVRYLGGTKDGHHLEVTGAPRLQRGDEVVLFLTHTGSGELPGILGLEHGTVRVQHTGDRTIVRGGNAADGEPLAAFVARVRAAIGAHPATSAARQEGK